MIQVPNVTADPKQCQKVRIASNAIVEMHLEYKPQQLGWFFNSIIYAPTNFQVNGRRLVTGYNIIRQFKNLVPFGIAVITADNWEPMLQQDFSSGYANLYILTAAEVAYYEAFLTGAVGG